MNTKIKDLAMKAYETVSRSEKLDPAKLDTWIDAYVLELTKNIVFACSDVVREHAKNAPPELARELKVVAVDMLDEFGL